jgi:hypothetical protein
VEISPGFDAPELAHGGALMVENNETIRAYQWLIESRDPVKRVVSRYNSFNLVLAGDTFTNKSSDKLNSHNANTLINKISRHLSKDD